MANQQIWKNRFLFNNSSDGGGRFYDLLQYSMLLFTLLLLNSCGKTSVNIDSYTYEPKIVIAGMLYPHQDVKNIKISRNFPVGEEIDMQDIDLSRATVTITDLQASKLFTLSYNTNNNSFEYLGNDLDIEYGSQYRLDVSAQFDGYNLSASSITAIPDRGMTIVRDSSIYGSLYYREKDSEGDLISPTLVYTKSANAAFYLASISAFEASTDNFIYENPPGMDINKLIDKGKATIEDFQYQSIWDNIQYENTDGLATMEINWFTIWFYSQYRIILYAADSNYYHFFLTHQFVQGIDGNLHEPIFDIDGDGIGYFGSAICDTVYLDILKN